MSKNKSTICILSHKMYIMHNLYSTQYSQNSSIILSITLNRFFLLYRILNIDRMFFISEGT